MQERRSRNAAGAAMTGTAPPVAISARGSTADLRSLAAAGALFLLYPLTRPWGDAAETTAAAAFASPAWPTWPR
jgi:hypothetical protein